ncbi:hypothetical protein KCU89_g151, partial [Aureobasidium melanogenum]
LFKRRPLESTVVPLIRVYDMFWQLFARSARALQVQVQVVSSALLRSGADVYEILPAVDLPCRGRVSRLPRAISVDSPPNTSICVSGGRLFTLTAQKMHPAMIHSSDFAAVSSNAIGRFWMIAVFDSFHDSGCPASCYTTWRKGYKSIQSGSPVSQEPADSNRNSLSLRWPRALKIIHADVFDGLLADAKNPMTDGTRANWEYDVNKVMIDLSLHKVGIRRNDRRTLENCYQLDPLVALPPNKKHDIFAHNIRVSAVYIAQHTAQLLSSARLGNKIQEAILVAEKIGCLVIAHSRRATFDHDDEISIVYERLKVFCDICAWQVWCVRSSSARTFSASIAARISGRAGVSRATRMG